MNFFKEGICVKARNNINKEFIFILLLMFCSVGIRFCFADFNKSFLVYSDELRYLSLADSIAHGRGLEIYNIESGYQKIFYSLLLAPAYLLSNRIITIRVIALINVCLMSSGIIPVWLLGKKFLLSPHLRVLVCVLYLLGPDMTYSMTFMSETLYIPMAIWLIYFLCNLFEIEYNSRKKIIFSILIGVYIYLMYLTKEVALVFLLVIPALRIMEYIYERLNNIDFSSRVRFKCVFFESLLVFTSFLGCYLIMKSTLFAGWGNSYNQMSLDILLEDGRIRYLLYGFVYYICSCIVAFGGLPIFIPLFKFKSFSARERRLYMLLCALVIGTACVVTYTITVREDFGQAYEATPRAHLRYISYVIWPLLILFLSLLYKKEKSAPLTTGIFILLVGVIGTIFIMFWRGVYDGSSVDQTLLAYLVGLSENTLLIVTLCFVIGTVLSVAFFDKIKRVVVVLFVFFLSSTFLLSNVKKIQSYQQGYDITAEEYTDVMELDTFIAQHSDDAFIMITDQLLDNRRCIDTYISHENMYTVAWSRIEQQQQEYEGEIPISQLECWYNGAPYGIQTANYLVFEKDNTIFLLESEYEEVLSNEHYAIYNIGNSNCLPQLRDTTILIKGENLYAPDLYWPFFSSDPGIFISSGENTLMYGPYITLPAGTYSFEIYYSYVGEPVTPNTVLGYCDIYSDAVDLEWAQYVTNFSVSESVVKIENVMFNIDIPRFELRMMTHVAGVEIEKVIMYRQ